MSDRYDNNDNQHDSSNNNSNAGIVTDAVTLKDRSDNIMQPSAVQTKRKRTLLPRSLPLCVVRRSRCSSACEAWR